MKSKTRIAKIFQEEKTRIKKIRDKISIMQVEQRNKENALVGGFIGELLAIDLSDQERKFLTHKIDGKPLLERFLNEFVKKNTTRYYRRIDKRVILQINKELSSDKGLQILINSLNKTFEGDIKFSISRNEICIASRSFTVFR